MTLALSIFGIAFALLCIWLTMRIINRRQRWAKWTLALAVALPVLYVLSFGPTCWVYSRVSLEESDWESPDYIYAPVLWVRAYHKGIIPDAIEWYANLWSAREMAVAEAEGRPILVRIIVETAEDEPPDHP